MAVALIGPPMSFDVSDHASALDGDNAANELRPPRVTRLAEAERGPTLFRSFFLGGFECSSHRRRDGRRLDLITATRHDLLALEDYQQLRQHGIRPPATESVGIGWRLSRATTIGRRSCLCFVPPGPPGCKSCGTSAIMAGPTISTFSRPLSSSTSHVTRPPSLACTWTRPGVRLWFVPSTKSPI